MPGPWQTPAGICSAWAAFDRERFEALATVDLDALGLKARVLHICAAFEATLSASFDPAAAVIEASLEPSG